MRNFEVFHHTEDGHEAVKLGFSWPAFFFGWIWAVAKDLNFAVFGLFASIAGFFFLNYQLQESGNAIGALISSLTQLVFFIWVGWNGNKWRRVNLLKRGFTIVGTVAEKSPKRAIQSLSSPVVLSTGDA